jgi:hypothetical protein
MIGYRHADPRFPFLWESANQPAARWHSDGEGPVHYFADNPDGAWAEFLRHEEITDPDDVKQVRRALWAVDLQRRPRRQPNLPLPVLTGDESTYPACRQEARRLRRSRVARMVAPSAALVTAGAQTYRVDGGQKIAGRSNGWVIVVFGRAPRLVGSQLAYEARPSADLLARVRPL